MDHASAEFIELDNYLNRSRGSTHGIKYKVRIQHVIAERVLIMAGH